MVVPSAQDYIRWKINPPKRSEKFTVDMIAQALIKDHMKIYDGIFLEPYFMRYPRHSQGTQATPTAVQVATYIYPKREPMAAVIQYELDVVRVAKAWYAQEIGRRDEIATARAWTRAKFFGGTMTP